MKKIIILAAALLIIIVIVATVFLRRDNTQVILLTDIAEASDITVSLSQTGVIKPQVGAMISVGARATGTLEMVRVKVGDAVTEGELVARIDSRAIRQNIKQARDLLDQAKTDLTKIQRLHPLEKAMQQNSVTTALSNYEYLKGVNEREGVLYEEGYSLREALDKTRHEMISAQNEHERQKIQLDYLDAEYEAAVMTLRSEISRQQSILEEQEIQLTYTEIYSPITGIVSAVNSVEGETIVAGLEVAQLITVFRPELLEMYVYVDESDIGKVTEGMPVIYTVDTYINREFYGSISRINLQSETVDGVIYYVAIVDITPEDAAFLRPEMTTSVRIITEEKAVAVSIDRTAVKWEAGQQLVYRVLDRNRNLTEKVPVEVGARGEDRVEILSGIAAGEEVVVRFGQPGRGDTLMGRSR